MLTEEKMALKDTEANILNEHIMQFLPGNIRQLLMKTGMQRLEFLEEIRLRGNKPVMIHNRQGDWFIDIHGNLTRLRRNLYLVKPEDMIRTLELMSENSIYAYQDEIKNGFITLKGGHRVGIAGRVVLDNNSVRNIKDISGLNIRISREIPGCSSQVQKYIVTERNEVLNTLIISPPQCGKTTILRDLARVISDGVEESGFKGLKVGIIDERSEIAACFRGIPQKDVGIRTDVLDACPKAVGMNMMLRSMSPQVIVTDEIGNQGDKDAVMKVLNAGVKIITTAHGYNISELKTRQEVLNMMECRVFERYIVLSNLKGPGTLEEVVDGTTLKTLYKRL